MCPKLRIRCVPARKKQSGFLMPLALFILLGLGALALAISRLGAAQFSSAVQEGLSVQAFYAAESAAQLAMHHIIFDTQDKAAADSACASINGTTQTFSAVGLNECSARIVCAIVANVGDSAGIYRLESAATCGSGLMAAERSVITAVRYE
jgi:MSHA biogenesis protein MshP